MGAGGMGAGSTGGGIPGTGAATPPGLENLGAGPAPGAGAGAGAAGAGATDAGAAASGLGGGFAGSTGAFNMIGDQSPLFQNVKINATPFPGPAPGPNPAGRPPQIPSSTQQSLPFPTIRGFKIADNQSPRPQDRFFYTFNYYDNLNAAQNRYNQSPVTDMKAYRHVFGFEKTFDDGNGSIGLRLPLNTLTANSISPRNIATPTSTALGDLNIFAKYILKQNKQTGNLLSAGFSITPPTGSSTFGGSKYIRPLHTTELQPFLGYIFNFGKFYIQGFSELDVPVNYRDVTLIYNDVGFGYRLYMNEDRNAFITMVAPTFEVHSNNPLNHRNPYNKNDPAASTDVLNLTYGMNVQFYGTSNLAVGFVTPTTGTKPFDYEVIALFNVYFGRSRAFRPATPPPFYGG